MKAGTIIVTCASPFDFELAREAWLFSRPQLKDVAVEDLAGVDLPVMDFPKAIFQVTVPALLREWLVTFRNLIFWSRSSRIDNLETTNVYYVDYWANAEFLIDNHKQMLMQRDRGVHQDEYRRMLPMSYMADFSMIVSFRDFTKLMDTISFASESAKVDGKETGWSIALHDLWQGLFYSIDDRTRDLICLAPRMRLTYPAKSKLQPITNSKSYLTVPYGAWAKGASNSFVCAAYMPIMLRAQLARHRSFTIHDSLPDVYPSFAEAGTLITQGTSLTVEWSGSIEAAREVLAKRQCWIAHEGLWEQAIAAMKAAIGDEDARPALPCDCGACPFELDIRARFEGRDPAPPCPQYANLNQSWDEFKPFAQTAIDYAIAHKPKSTQKFWLKKISGATL